MMADAGSRRCGQPTGAAARDGQGALQTQGNVTLASTMASQAALRPTHVQREAPPRHRNVDAQALQRELGFLQGSEHDVIEAGKTGPHEVIVRSKAVGNGDLCRTDRRRHAALSHTLTRGDTQMLSGKSRKPVSLSPLCVIPEKECAGSCVPPSTCLSRSVRARLQTHTEADVRPAGAGQDQFPAQRERNPPVIFRCSPCKYAHLPKRA